MTNHPWLKSYPDDVDWSAPLVARPLYALLDEAERRWPQARALEFMGRSLTYRELAADVRKLTTALMKMGVGRRVKVGICLPNCPQAVIAYYAILKTGATVVNFSPLYGARELAHQIDDSGTEVMITLDLKLLYPKVAENLGNTKLKKLIVTSMTDALPLAKRLAFPLLKRNEIAEIPKNERHYRWEELLEDEEEARTLPTIHPESDMAVLQYTGGTTGVPKGVVLTHANLYINALQCGLWFAGAERGKEKIIGVLPFFHVFAMTTIMNFGIHIGAEIILHPRFELKKLLEDITAKKPTLMPGVPTLFNAITQYKELHRHKLTSLKYCISGGAPLPVEVKKEFERLTACVLVEGYGLSETSPVVCCNPMTGENKTGSIGLPFPGTVLEVVDPDSGKTLGTRETGEICIHGPQVMSGYWQSLDETANVLKNSRLHTGDLGYRDENGYFFIVDRLKEMIISGGFNIYPRHVEEAMYNHPAVAECAVIGMPHEKRGEVPRGFVVVKEGQALEIPELVEFLKGELPSYAVTRDIQIVESLPKTMIGKVDKKALRKL